MPSLEPGSQPHAQAGPWEKNEKTLSMQQKNPERLPEGQAFPESFFFNSASAVLGLKLGLEALVALGWCPVLVRGAV